MRFVVILAASLALSACGIAQGVGNAVSGIASPIVGAGFGARRGAVDIQGVRFRARIQTISEDQRDFAARGFPAAPLASAAVEAARTQAVTYCLRLFGGSQILWAVGPDVPAEEIVLDEGGGVTLRGRCIAR